MLAGRFDPKLFCFDTAPERGLFLGCTASAADHGQPSHFRDAQGQAWQVPELGRDVVPAGWQPIDPASILPGSSTSVFGSCYATFL